MDAKTNVIMVGPDRSLHGGISAVVNGLIEAGLPELCNLTYIATNVEGSKLSKVIKAASALAYFNILVKRCDIVHVHMASRYSYERKRYFVELAHKANKPVIIHMHGGEWKEFFKNECTDKKRTEIIDVFGKASRVIVLSDDWNDFFAENVCEASKIIVMHNAVKIPKEHSGELLVSPYKNVLFLGRLDENKSPDLLLRASARIALKHPRLRLQFAGDGSIDYYKHLADELKIVNLCSFFGWVDRDTKKSLLLEASIVCLPSKNEGMPMSILEAMSYGIPVVATPVGGIPQIIQDGVNGLLVPISNVEALSEALDRLLSDEKLRKQLGGAGRQTIKQSFCIKTTIFALADLYQIISKRNNADWL